MARKSAAERSEAGRKAATARWAAALRKRGGRTLDEIAGLLGYTRQALHSYRTKRRPWPPGLKKRFEEMVKSNG